jgi:hypothetical protein
MWGVVSISVLVCTSHDRGFVLFWSLGVVDAVVSSAFV